MFQNLPRLPVIAAAVIVIAAAGINEIGTMAGAYGFCRISSQN